MGSNLRILADENVSNAHELFTSLGHLTLLPASQINAETVKKIDVLIIRSKTIVNQELLQFSNVKYVLSTVSGTDHINFDYLRNNNINYFYAKGCNANSVVHYCLIALLNTLNEEQKLHKLKVAIIGYGNVGEKLSKLLTQLKVKVFVYDPPYFKQNNIPNDNKVTICTQLSHLNHCDVISVHAALHNNTYNSTNNLINKSFIELLSAPQIFINTSRGELVDENSLLNRLQKKSPPKVIIDCWDNEPNINQNLIKLAEIATPHIAGHSRLGLLDGSIAAQKKLKEWLNLENGLKIKKNQPLPLTIDCKTCKSTEQCLTKVMNQVCPINNDSLKEMSDHLPIKELFTQKRSNHIAYLELKEYKLDLINVPPSLIDTTHKCLEIIKHHTL